MRSVFGMEEVPGPSCACTCPARQHLAYTFTVESGQREWIQPLRRFPLLPPHQDVLDPTSVSSARHLKCRSPCFRHLATYLPREAGTGYLTFQVVLPRLGSPEQSFPNSRSLVSSSPQIQRHPPAAMPCFRGIDVSIAAVAEARMSFKLPEFPHPDGSSVRLYTSSPRKLGSSAVPSPGRLPACSEDGRARNPRPEISVYIPSMPGR